MLDEQVEQAGSVLLEFGEAGDDVVGYEVGAARAGWEGEGTLEPSWRDHDCGSCWFWRRGGRTAVQEKPRV